jgi:hypothetical protein
MASRKTWLWIIVGVFGTCMLLLIVVAGGLFFFVTSHVNSRQTTSSEAFRTFDTTRAEFRDQKPLLEIDDRDRPRVPKALSTFPTSSTRPEQLCVLAWDPEEERVVQLSLPFWLLKLGRRKIDVSGNHGFDFDQLNIDVNELERIGPQLILDLRKSTGQRVLVWTK